MQNGNVVPTVANVLSVAMSYGFVTARICGNNVVGSCPFCGGHDRFIIDVAQDRWFCRKSEGHQGNNRGDAIQLIMLVERCDYVTANQILSSSDFLPTNTVAPATPRPIGKREKSFDLTAMRKIFGHTRHIMTKSIAEKYLLSRGLSVATQEAWRFGCGYFPFKGERFESITIPWLDSNNHFVGLSHRIIEPTGDTPRVAWHSGMAGHIAGLLCGWHTHKAENATLCICEGVLNAPSVMQARPHFNALSAGSENSDETKWDLDAIRRHTKIYVWCDKAEVAQRWADTIGSGAIPVTSKVAPDGTKLDANALLMCGALNR